MGARRCCSWLLLALFALQTPPPWARAVAGGAGRGRGSRCSLAWRFGARGVAGAGGAARGGALALGGPARRCGRGGSRSAALTGAWMGLREEGGGPALGERAWMLLPVLVLAAALPWLPRYARAGRARVERELTRGDAAAARAAAPAGLQPASGCATLERSGDRERRRCGTQALPLRAPDRAVRVDRRCWSRRAARSPRASRRAAALAAAVARARCATGGCRTRALWLLLAGLALLLVAWPAWRADRLDAAAATRGSGYCVQGIAVVESLLLARGVPPPVIVLTMLFVFAIAMPVFILTTAALGLSDVWLDYRRLEPVPDGDRP